ncbi:hypothetical protein BGZ60DRAFT_436989 [Tricladium varicosporioides]|nr:hypothetical protein BGZ60DRAFT_436989 [Hymenoscyphus varicosporioides]
MAEHSTIPPLLTHEKKPNFCNLPSEIRNLIYEYCLVSPRPIIAWLGKRESYCWETKSWMDKIPNRGNGVKWPGHVRDKVMISSIKHITLPLLRTKKQIYHECAKVLYEKNTFCFRGEHNWEPILSWLKRIGTANQGYLTSLQIATRRPQIFACMSTGELVPVKSEWTQEELSSQDPCDRDCLSDDTRGLVNNINPVLEDIFIYLAKRTGHEKLSIIMQLAYGEAPCLGVWIHPETAVGYWVGLELQNLVEKYQYKYCWDYESNHLVDASWKGYASCKEVLLCIPTIETLGWSITIEGPGNVVNMDGQPDRSGMEVDFILKRPVPRSPTNL